MKRHLLVATAAVALVLIAAPAYAFHCPLDIAAIDNGLAKARVSAEVKAQAKALRDEGEALHKAGKHGDALNKLSAAMRLILGAM